ncbi:hypothetical protein BD309DRAFT_1016616 [Dichomitus squalens]|uniref:DUF6533 domain-containing protein n=1 Tax=Dichomitus squalens (strain LYAD-421) TaxID=732165 RepID=R7SQA5_DICSQ|nr:uncharacterized protein DICSQDRAFT_173052 [Dichomitus squalens LYAD-421 SS1]EJF58374.1 hypothetical protein DICSQDRAFT_173052 [Dichomitus squalens LYAD-421 SS1]TBU47141.1 hypothetical protein BD309DRAFT_1016616 [Dichomitus squalens]
MADNSDVQVATEVFFGNCWTSATTALLAYDFVLTFPSEVTLFWKGGHLSGATLLCLLNRYITLASQVINNVSLPSAFSVYIAAAVLQALQYLPWAAFSALRAYALCPDPYRWVISAGIFALSSVPIVTDLWVNLHGLSVVNDPVLGIIAITPVSASTITKALLVLSILQMTFTLTGIGNKVDSPTSVIALLEEPLTSILISRFLIDLQKAQCKLAGSSRSVSLGEVAFQSQTSGSTGCFVGSLGAQLSCHEVDEEEDEMEHRL